MVFPGQMPRTALAASLHLTVGVLEAELLKSDVYLQLVWQCDGIPERIF